jgi:5'(3')-deoxyribonucleotidase
MNSKKPIVLVDMDGVLADFDKEVVNRLVSRYPDIPILKTRHNFYISDDYPNHSLILRTISDEKGFFESLPLAKDALEGWQRLLDLGYHPIICSAPMQSNPRSKIEKLSWLEKHFVPIFGKDIVREAIITSDKHLHDGIALIDDRPEFIDAERARWGHILFSHPYNQHIASELRLYGWHDKNLPNILKYLEDIYHKNNISRHISDMI